ncbi:major facilitator superfamily transporter [Ceratobasidium sp. AG-Ba]|nr:major facilitator superfamily transporter [Ceratobasidium sp. AG-Ba]
MGIVFTGSSCGGMIFPIMLNNIIKRAGFGWGVRATGFVVLACLLGANLMMKTRLPPKPAHHKGHSSDIRGVMKDGAYLLTVLGIFIAQLGIWFPIFYLQLFAVRHNLDRNLAFYSLTILNAASILGRTFPNFISDRIGVFNVMIPCSTIGGVLVFAMFGVKSSGALVVFAVLYGFFSGSFFSLMSPLIVSLADHMHEVGLRLGFAFTVIGIATLIGTPISGALLSDNYTWYRPIVFCGILFLAGSGCLVVARGMHARHKGLFLV